MPNWCATNITFYTDVNNIKELEELHKSISEVITAEKSLLENDFGTGWLGNILHKHGIALADIRCRGEITSLGEITDSHFEVQEYGAWAPQTETWERVISKTFPNVNFVYVAEEPGNGVYINTDDGKLFYTDSFKMDSYLPACDEFDLDAVQYVDGEYHTDYFESKEDLLEGLNDLCAKEAFNDVESAIVYIKKLCSEKCCDSAGQKYYFHLHEFTGDE